jgi:hypothetical protein
MIFLSKPEPDEDNRENDFGDISDSDIINIHPLSDNSPPSIPSTLDREPVPSTSNQSDACYRYSICI